MKDDTTVMDFEDHELIHALEGVANVLAKTRLGGMLCDASATDLGVPLVFNSDAGVTASLVKSRDYDREWEPSDFVGEWRAHQEWVINLSDLARRDVKGETIIAEIAGLSASSDPAVAAVASFVTREWISGVEAIIGIRAQRGKGPAALVRRVNELLENFDGNRAVEMDDALDPVEYGVAIQRDDSGGFVVSEVFAGDMGFVTGHKATIANLDAAVEAMREACNVPAVAPGPVSR